ncbi:MAG: amidoligase family protein [Euryarchaeota archaeon]|nr:amidoligase family protein [Euryarchaeota archaeon]
MDSGQTRFEPPPRTRTEEGRPRHVGFELEFKGLSLETTARIVRDLFGGKLEQKDRSVWTVTGTRYGDFRVELDWWLLKAHTLGEHVGGLGGEVVDKIEDVLFEAARPIVPFEIVTPPFPLERLSEVERLRAVLHVHDVHGTRSRPSYCLGLHINPEAPSHDADDILAHLRAFILLHGRIMQERHTDPVRRIWPYIDPYPVEYQYKVLHPDYAPDLGTLFDDYLAYNPTRNRALDLLPLFAHIDPDHVEPRLTQAQVNARPTYHYRLPDCAIDDPHWRIASEWNRWVAVERLALDPERMGRLAEERLGPLQRLLAREEET